MPVRKFKRGGVWYIRGRGPRQSKGIYRSTGTGDEALAEEIRAREEARQWDRGVRGLRGTTTFSEAANAYLKVKMPGATDANAIVRLLKWFGSWPLADIDQGAVEKYIAAKMPKTGPASQIRYAIGPVSAILNFAAKRGWCDAPKFDRPKLPPGVVRWITYEEADRLIAECAPHMAPIVIFLLLTGARVGEAMGLDWRNVDLQAGRAAFLDTKNGTSRGVPLHGRVVAALANLPHREGPVFRRPDGHAYEGRPTDAIKTGFKAACRRAGIKNLRIHDLRHTFASWMVMSGADLRTVAELLGHKSLHLVMRYSHLSPNHLRAAIERLGHGVADNKAIPAVSSQRER